MLALVGSWALGGCGFRPLYGEQGASASPETLSSIRIAPIGDRLGQQLHNALRDHLNAHGQPVDPTYVLDVTVDSKVTNLQLRRDETARRAQVALFSGFRLRRAADNQRLFKGRSLIINSYNILDEQFAAIAAEQDARERGIDELARDISRQVAGFLAQHDADR